MNFYFTTLKDRVKQNYFSLFHRLIQNVYNKHIYCGDRFIENGFKERFTRTLFRFFRLDKAVLIINHQETQKILNHFPEVDIPFDNQSEQLELKANRFISEKQRLDFMPRFKDYVTEIQEKKNTSYKLIPSSYTIAIPFYAHFDYLKQCLDSIALNIIKSQTIIFEVLILNDDPKISEKRISSIIPNTLQPFTRIISNEKNIGICSTLNRGIEHAKYNWIVHLDCDDMISENCLSILEQRIRQFPQVRYISSRMLDIDQHGNILRCRLRPEKPSQLISHGMIAGHLKVIRKDLFQEIGGYINAFEGCQDYEFAIRTTFFEPILFIPDYIYKYRWHGKTQSVSKAKKQADTTNKIIDMYLLASMILSGAYMPVYLTFVGRDESKWKDCFYSQSGSVVKDRNITIEMSKEFNDDNRKLFAISLAQHLVDNPDSKESERILF